MQCYDSVLDVIGQTPLIRLNNMSNGFPGIVLAKVEGMNPGHSAKDRIAKYIIAKAEKEGKILPGGTIIEASSGNTGFSMAMVAAVKGYNCILCIPDKISKEKIQLMESLGADVRICPSKVAYEDPLSHYSVCARLNQEIKNSLFVNQYFNADNLEAHYHTTGPEIWNQTEGKITHFICAMGTGGTISGTAKYLKEQNPEVKIIGVDAYGSILQKYHEDHVEDSAECYSYFLEAVGKKFIPGATEFDLIDKIVKASDRESALLARRLAKKQGLLTGYSSGAVLVGFKKIQRLLPKDAVVVLLLADHGSRYLSKIYNNAWMQHVGFFRSADRKSGISKVVYLREQLRKVIDFYS